MSSQTLSRSVSSRTRSRGRPPHSCFRSENRDAPSQQLNRTVLCRRTNVFSISVFINVQHPFISQAKPVSILRDLITEAMEMKAKRQQEQQRELEEDDDNSVRLNTTTQTSPGSDRSRGLCVTTDEGRGFCFFAPPRRRRPRWTLTPWSSRAQRGREPCGPPAP